MPEKKPVVIEDQKQYSVTMLETVAGYGPAQLVFLRGTAFMSGAALRDIQTKYPTAIGDFKWLAPS